MQIIFSVRGGSQHPELFESYLINIYMYILKNLYLTL